MENLRWTVPTPNKVLVRLNCPTVTVQQKHVCREQPGLIFFRIVIEAENDTLTINNVSATLITNGSQIRCNQHLTTHIRGCCLIDFPVTHLNFETNALRRTFYAQDYITIEPVPDQELLASAQTTTEALQTNTNIRVPLFPQGRIRIPRYPHHQPDATFPEDVELATVNRIGDVINFQNNSPEHHIKRLLFHKHQLQRQNHDLVAIISRLEDSLQCRNTAPTRYSTPSPTNSDSDGSIASTITSGHLSLVGHPTTSEANLTQSDSEHSEVEEVQADSNSEPDPEGTEPILDLTTAPTDVSTEE